MNILNLHRHPLKQQNYYVVDRLSPDEALELVDPQPPAEQASTIEILRRRKILRLVA